MRVADQSRHQVLAGLRGLESALRAEGVTHLAIFGSRARGDHRADSDLDILIEVEAGRKFSLLDLVGVSHTIEDSLGIPANIFMKRSLEPQIAETIESDIVEVF
ncbi:MAG: nucleotidyltransferase family protein [Pseudorhodoplanes sp.]|uniref:nucleotidyltransferase family protein n=1 Tax=Pseudorhodoplanes sp. TaxID=1934341 RepID=UPI003D0CCBC3